MKLQTQISIHKAQNQIDYTSQLLVLGSCFAENIGAKLKYFKFQVVQNPLGILFHPVAIEKLIERAVNKELFSEKDTFFLNERWHCFDAHSELSDTSQENLLRKLNTGLKQTYQQISKATYISITLGTAWVYKNNKTNTVVANCHKVPQKAFLKELLSVTEIQASLKNINQILNTINPPAKIIYTVSPVRHIKDGFVENQRSKAHLITALHGVIATLNCEPHALYFPSYELMMDELRDYRFYKADMLHPNKVAINYIWEKFKETYIDENVYAIMTQVDVINKGLLHRPFNKASEKHQLFLKDLEKKIAYLQQVHSHITFSK